MGVFSASLDHSLDLETMFESVKQSLPSTATVIMQNTSRVRTSDSLFYTPVVINGSTTVRAMLDTGSMACTINEDVERKLTEDGSLDCNVKSDTDIVLVGCGGKLVDPKTVCDLQFDLYGCTVVVPTLVVPGQVDDLIIGTNVIKFLTHKFKDSDMYWKVVSTQCSSDVGDGQDDFVAMLAGVRQWKGDDLPDKVGTVKLRQAVTLLPGHEHLVWGKLPGNLRGPPGSTVMVEPTSSRAVPRNILVGRVVTPLWGDGWVPMKIMNPTDKPVVLRRNAKVADVHPCLALEDMQDGELSRLVSNSQHINNTQVPIASIAETLNEHGLNDLDIDSCEVSESWRNECVNLQ